MKKTLIVAAACISALLLSCTSDSTGPAPAAPGFKFRVTVRDTAGRPVPGLLISATNQLSIRAFGGRAAAKRPGPSDFPQSTVMFANPVPCDVTISMVNLSGALLNTVVQRRMVAGWHIETFSAPSNLTQVYRLVMDARDTVSGGVVFRDSVLAVEWNPDAVTSTIGTTSSTGVFETQDRLLFPNLFSLPPLVFTVSDPTPIDTFHFLDTVGITLTNPASGDTQADTVVVGPEENSFFLLWDPQPPVAGPKAERLPAGEAETRAEGSALTVWDTLIVADAAGYRQVLYFGPADTIDLDRYELPPPAPGFDARYETNRYLELADRNRVKETLVLIARAAYPVTISWGISPEAGIRASLKVGTAVYDMSQSGSVAVPDNREEVFLVLVPEVGEVIPTEFRLEQNYPNPFN